MSTTDPLMNLQLGDYKIVGLLGRGGMARVYRGYDARLERYAAVKVIDANLTAENEEEYRQRFLREARSIARLNHPSIVSIYQFGEVNNVYYMAMAFIEGRDLSHILREHAAQGKLIAQPQVINIIRDIASALDHAHHEGVIHRDVKPSNIMVTEDGRAILTDFGLALSVPEGTIGNTFGSAHYIAPEQAVSSANAVPQSDLYSLGIVLYQMLVGKVPFDDPSAMSVALKHLSDPPPQPSRLNPRISPQLESVILKALEKEPFNRYASGVELARALDEAVNAGGDVPSTGSSPLRLSTPPTSPSQPIAAPSSPSRPLVDDRSPTWSKQSLPKSPTQGSIPSKSMAARPQPEEKPRRGGQVVIAAVIILLLIGGAAALVFSTTNQDQPPASPTQVAAAERATATERRAAAAVTDEDAEPTDTSAPTASPMPTSTPSEVPPTDTDAPTDAPTEAPTDAPAPTETEQRVSPGDLPSPTPQPQIVLRYNENTMWLYNATDRILNVSNLTFIQERADNSLSFSGSDWYGSAETLEPQACLQVWKLTISELPVPENCLERPYWRAVADDRWFWQSDAEDTTFDVRLGDDVIATCEIDAGQCGFNIRSLN
jgi:serine/threonine protein kinase